MYSFFKAHFNSDILYATIHGIFFFNLILNTVQSSGLNSAIAEEHRNVSVQTLTLTQHACKPGGNETEKENQMRAYLNFVFSVSFSLEVGRTASS